MTDRWWSARVGGYAWFVLACLIAVGSLVPGTLVGSWSEASANLRSGAALMVQDPVILTVLERCAAFLPLGWLMFAKFVSRRRHRPILLSCLVVILFAMAIELTQTVLQDRHARLSDFVLAAVFGWIGVRLAAWLGDRPTPGKLQRLLASAIVFGNVVTIFAVALSHRGLELSEWDCDYPLLVANEFSANRPWLGLVRGLAIYPRTLTADEVARLADASLSPDHVAIRQDMGALAFYSFASVDAGHRVPQLLQGGPPRDLLLPPSGPSSWEMEGDWLRVHGPVVIRSAGPAREACQAIMASGAFAAEIEIATTGAPQDGPARILSLSSDSLHRNFTLGEDLGALVVRVRTPRNGVNGTALPLRTTRPVLSKDRHHIVFGYARGTVSLFLDGIRSGAPLEYPKLMIIGEGKAVLTAVFAGAAFVAMGALASLLLPRRGWLANVRRTYALSALGPIVAAVGLSAWLGHDQDLLLLAAAGIGPGVGLVIVLALQRLLWGGRRQGGRPAEHVTQVALEPHHVRGL